MRIVLTMALVLGFGIAEASALDITSCQVRVPRGEVGVLQSDVNCAAAVEGGPYSAITLERNAVLDLNGFTLDHYSIALVSGVFCEGRCEIRGPGRLVSSNLNAGVSSFSRAPLVISNVDFEGQITGVQAPSAKMTLTNVSIQAHTWGAQVFHLLADGVAVTVDPTGRGCIETSSSSAWVRGKDVTLAGCDVGIGNQGSVDVTNLTAMNLRTAGVFLVRKKLRLVDSTVTGSPIDLISRKTPILSGTTCGTSAAWDKGALTGETFGVCAND
jgi:hypothetical protein